jgi:hypothetical protein
MLLSRDSNSLRRLRISETKEACRVGVNRLGSRMEIFSSFAASASSNGSGGNGAGELDTSVAGVPYREVRRDKE